MNPSASEQIIGLLESFVHSLKGDLKTLPISMDQDEFYSQEEIDDAIADIHAEINKINNIIFAINEGRIYINECIGDVNRPWDVENKEWLSWVEYGKQLGLNEWNARKEAANHMNLTLKPRSGLLRS